MRLRYAHEPSGRYDLPRFGAPSSKPARHGSHVHRRPPEPDFTPMSTATSQVRRVILGTAGHIDHGKTSLVKRLTGTWTDTLPEEKERGMTIDVGYAAYEMPDGTEVGLLDVPGHERLVRTMVAAATAMDLAMLIVAADDGPMPQTREHVEILDVLGVTRLLVALTKCDLVDDETRELAEEEIREMLEPTGMAGAPIVRVSSETGEGFDALHQAIADAVPPRGAKGEDPFIFRMPVLRRFHVAGLGTVLTGIPVSGHVALGDRVDVLPRDWTGKLRAVQVHHRDAEAASRGHRAALALSDVNVSKVKRGMVVTTADVLKPTRRFAARVRVLGGARKALEHNSRARVHVGADQVVAKLHLPARKAIEPGGSALVVVEAQAPTVVAPGDRLVLREENASGTIGGGVVIEWLDGRLPKRQGIIDTLLARADKLDDPVELVKGVLESGGDRGVMQDDVPARTALRPDVVTRVLEELKAAGEVTSVGRAGRWIQASSFDKLQRRVDDTVKKLHAKDEAVDSLSLADVRAALGRMEPAVVEEVLAFLTSKGRLVRTEAGTVRHKDHSSELPAKDKALCDKVLAVLAAGGGRPPAIEDIEAEAGLTNPQVERALRLMEGRKMVFKTETHWFAGTWIDEAKAKLRAHAEATGGFTPAEARELLDTTRKWVIPLLEALDKSGFSRRAGDRRVLRES